MLRKLGEETGSPLLLSALKTRSVWMIALLSLLQSVTMAALFLLAAGFLALSYGAQARPLFTWLAFLAFGMAALRLRSGFGGFLCGMLVGAGAYLGILYWIAPVVYFGTGSNAMALGAAVALSVILALQFGFFGAVCAVCNRLKWVFPLAGACAWVGFEFLHQLIAYKLFAFPWFTLAYTQVDFKALLQVASLGGGYAVGFLIVLFGFGLAVALQNQTRAAVRITWGVLPAALLGLALAWGGIILNAQKSAPMQTISAALMQPYTHTLLLDGYEEDVIYAIRDQAAALEGKKTDLIIWPESSYPGSFEDEGYYSFLQELSTRAGNAYQVTGSYSAGPGGDYVSAALFNETGFLDFYHKNKLVPFGEFLPFTGLLGGFYHARNIASLTGSFLPGQDAGKVFRPFFGARAAIFGASICFESLFPSIWRAQAKNGAEFFVNISNDAWFGLSAAPYQHLRANALRAVETRRPVLRVANTGISAWIDAVGNIKYQTAYDAQATAFLYFSYSPSARQTFYTRYGDIFAYLCLFLAITFFISAMVFAPRAGKV